MKKVLIIGASGFVGTALYNSYAQDSNVLGTYFENPRGNLVPLDIRDKDKTMALITSFNPDIVIHTAALSSPNVCEEKKEDAEQINHIGTRNIVAACQKIGARLDYVSSVYIFDGEKGNYIETDTPNPINWYGKTKLEAEHEISTLSKYGIYRIDKLYGYNGEKENNDDLSNIKPDKPFFANSEQVRQPLFIDDMVKAIRLMQDSGTTGILHLAGPDKVSKYELDVRLASLIGRESSVIPVLGGQQNARVPRNTSLVTSKAKALGINFTNLDMGMKITREKIASGSGIESQLRAKEN